MMMINEMKKPIAAFGDCPLGIGLENIVSLST